MGNIAAPCLPRARGPVSDAVITALAEWTPGEWYLHESRRERPGDDNTARLRADPFGADLQLALYVCYELHYHGFAGVDPGGSGTPNCSTYAASSKDGSSRDCAPTRPAAATPVPLSKG